jgi:hypothetical protein
MLQICSVTATIVASPRWRSARRHDTAFGGGPRHVKMLGGPHDRPALVDDTTSQHQPAPGSQNSVSWTTKASCSLR